MNGFLRRHWPLSALAGLLLLAMVWSMLAPLRGLSHELLLEFPGAAGGPALAVPREIRLTRGVQDVLLLRNRSSVPLVFGPLKIGAGRDLRLPFGDEGLYEYACPRVEGGLVRVRVVAAPDPGWGRLRWRLGNLRQTVRYLPRKSPED